MSSLLAAHHPTIFKFVRGLKKQQTLTNLKIEQLLMGHSQSKGRSTYVLLAERLFTLCEGYGGIPILDYLKGIAQNLNLNP